MKINFTGNTKINVLYFNDAHANVDNQKYLKTASDKFEENMKDKLILNLQVVIC